MLEELDAILRDPPRWYREEWSIVDPHFYWCYITAKLGEFPLEGFDAIAQHRRRVEEQASLRRA